jgi:predicted acyltransferase (DUF342 family)
MVKNIPTIERSTKIRFGKNCTDDQAENTIVFNASNAHIDASQPGTMYMTPVRRNADFTDQNITILSYNQLTKEVMDSGATAEEVINVTLENAVINGNVTSNTVSFNDPETSITTLSNVGVANGAPIHTLDVGTKFYVDEEGSNVLSVSGNVTIQGDLNVTGSVTTLDTTNLTIKDAIVELGKGNLDSDMGIIMDRTGTNVTMGYIENEEEFIIAYTDSNANDSNIIPSSNSINTHIYGNLELDSNLSVHGPSFFVDGLFSNLRASNNFNVSNVFSVDDANASVAINTVAYRGGSLEVLGDSYFDGNVTANGGVLHVNQTDSRVGVNTITPNVELDVLGRINATGSIDTDTDLNVAGEAYISSNLNAQSHLNVTGNANAQSELNVTGNAFVSSNLNAQYHLNVTGNANAQSHLNVTGNANAQSHLNVTGNANAQSELNVTGNAFVSSNLNAQSELNVTGNAFISSNLNAQSELNVTGNAFISSNLNAQSELNVTGNAFVSSNVIVTGNTDVQSELNVTGNAFVSSNLNAQSELNVTGNAFISSNLNAQSELNVTGNAFVSSNLNAQSELNVTGNAFVSSNLNAQSELNVTGNAFVSSNVIVTGNTDVQSELNVTGNAFVSSNLNAQSELNVTGNAFVSSNLNAQSELNVTGNAFVSSNLNAQSELNVTGNAFVSSNLNAQSELNVTGNAFVSSNLNAQSELNVTGNAFVSSNVIVTGNTDVQSELNVTGNAFVSSNLNAQSELNVTGNAFISSNTIVSGNVDVQSELNVTGNAFVDSNIVVTNNVHAATYYGDGGLLSNLTLQVVSDHGNVTSNTIQFTNPTTALATDLTSNVEVKLNQLSNVTIDTPIAEHLLVYDGSNWVNDFPKHTYIQIRNDAGVDIDAGDAVYVKGTHNANVLNVGLAQSNSPGTMPCIGLSNQVLIPGQEGTAVAYGKALSVVTEDFIAGETVYVSNTVPGGLSNVKPYNNDLIQNVGVVTKVHESNGGVFVTGIGRANDIPNAPIVLDETDINYVYVNNQNNDLKKIEPANLLTQLQTFEQVSAAGNVVSNTMEFNNVTTGLVTVANVEVGSNISVAGLADATNKHVPMVGLDGFLEKSPIYFTPGGTYVVSAAEAEFLGNLTLSGNTTILNSESVTISDRIFGVASNNSASGLDSGFVIEHQEGSPLEYANVALIYHADEHRLSFSYTQNTFTDDHILHYEDETHRMLIDLIGNVEVQHNLVVNENVDVTGVTSLASDLTVGAASNLFVDVSTSRVGINEGTPAASLDVGGDARIQDTTDSSSVTTGALVVSGGLGVASNIHSTNVYAGSHIGVGIDAAIVPVHVIGTDAGGVYINGDGNDARVTLEATGITADPVTSFTVNGGESFSVGIDNSQSDTFNISNHATDVGTNARLTITPSGTMTLTNTTTSLITAGSVGIANSSPIHDLDVGSNLYVEDTGSNVVHVTGNIYATEIHSDYTRVSGNVDVQSELNVTGNVDAQSELNVTGNAYFTSNVLINGPTAATSTTTGALQVAGGVGVVGEIHSGAISAAKDQDVTSYLGRAAIGYNGTQSDQATFAHVDHNTSGSYALKQSTGGSTQINSKVGQSLIFSIDNAEKGIFKGNGDFAVDTDTLYVDTTNDRVGVNTSTPGSALDVHGDGAFLHAGSGTPHNSNDLTLRLGGLNSSGSIIQSKCAIIVTPNTSYGGEADYGRNAMHFCTRNTQDNTNADLSNAKISILPNGNVGFGNPNPDKGIHARTFSNSILAGLDHVTTSGSSGDDEYVGLGLGVTGSGQGNRIFKGGIFFERKGGDTGRGDLLFCIENTQDNSTEVSPANAIMRITRNSDVGITGNLNVSGGATFDTDTLVVDSVNDRVGINNASPSHDLDIGSNLYVEDTGSNVLTVTGGILANTLTIGDVTVTPGYSFNLENITSVGATTSNTVHFQNNDTSLITNSNVGIGTTSPETLLHVNGGVITNSDAFTRKLYSYSDPTVDFNFSNVALTFASNVFSAKITAQLVHENEEVSTMVFNVQGGTRDGTTSSLNIAPSAVSLFGNTNNRPWNPDVTFTPTKIILEPLVTGSADYSLDIFVEYLSSAATGKLETISVDNTVVKTFSY